SISLCRGIRRMCGVILPPLPLYLLLSLHLPLLLSPSLSFHPSLPPSLHPSPSFPPSPSPSLSLSLSFSLSLPLLPSSDTHSQVTLLHGLKRANYQLPLVVA